MSHSLPLKRTTDPQKPEIAQSKQPGIDAYQPRQDQEPEAERQVDKNQHQQGQQEYRDMTQPRTICAPPLPFPEASSQPFLHQTQTQTQRRNNNDHFNVIKPDEERDQEPRPVSMLQYQFGGVTDALPPPSQSQAQPQAQHPELLRRPDSASAFKHVTSDMPPLGAPGMNVVPLNLNFNGVETNSGMFPFVSGPGYGGEQLYMAVPVNLACQVPAPHGHMIRPLPETDEHGKHTKKRKRRNRLCGHKDCQKNARGRTAFCVRHGGGIRCAADDCEKGARPHSEYCSAHGGGQRCLEPGCNKGALAKSVYCRRHGKMRENTGIATVPAQIPRLL